MRARAGLAVVELGVFGELSEDALTGEELRQRLQLHPCSAPTRFFGLLMSLNMLIEFGDAFDYTGADFAGWARQVGFTRTEVIALAGPGSAAVAYK